MRSLIWLWRFMAIHEATLIYLWLVARGMSAVLAMITGLSAILASAIFGAPLVRLTMKKEA